MDTLTNTRRSFFGLVPAIAATTAIPSAAMAGSPIMTRSDIQARIDHHLEIINRLYLLKHPNAGDDVRVKLFVDHGDYYRGGQ